MMISKVDKHNKPFVLYRQIDTNVTRNGFLFTDDKGMPQKIIPVLLPEKNKKLELTFLKFLNYKNQITLKESNGKTYTIEGSKEELKAKILEIVRSKKIVLDLESQSVLYDSCQSVKNQELYINTSHLIKIINHMKDATHILNALLQIDSNNFIIKCTKSSRKNLQKLHDALSQMEVTNNNEHLRRNQALKKIEKLIDIQVAIKSQNDSVAVVKPVSNPVALGRMHKSGQVIRSITKSNTNVSIGIIDATKDSVSIQKIHNNAPNQLLENQTTVTLQKIDGTSFTFNSSKELFELGIFSLLEQEKIPILLKVNKQEFY